MKRNASHHKSLTRNSLLVMMCLLLSGLVFACDPGTTSPGVEIDTNTACCADCICRGDAPTQSSYRNGPYRYTSYNLPRTSYRAGATVYYPTNAEPPFAGIVYCPPYTGTESMLAAWGPFFASHGIVLVTMSTTTTMDTVDSRDDQQRDALDALKAEHTRSGSPLQGKLSNRFGVMGWSMGGGATWINASKVAGLKSAMSLAGHNATALDRDARGGNIKCPTLIMNGATDMTILGGMGQSSGVYDAIANNIPKILYEVRGVGHMSWMTPTQPGNAAAELALAFQKTFLEGDTRWGEFIVQEPRNASDWETNIRVR
ncbi:dienelactone hydrolase family protein [Desulfatitalea alkaliphila]|uniref:Dienelactone hydrolase family protein n=1 Tax=Desulfatitalea alkaliphila TaxID=2929485 RepID=A0AA41UI38_9BACT|nr:dienelactone hydrolase family protein [Desulfatitalea alkaliphila]MCJ8500340.1 dienelactone hydrolase family protein [Desulfatitalea alkaliphila]